MQVLNDQEIVTLAAGFGFIGGGFTNMLDQLRESVNLNVRGRPLQPDIRVIVKEQSQVPSILDGSS